MCQQSELDCNFINAIDGLSGSSIVVKEMVSDPPDHYGESILEADQVLELVGKIVADIVQGQAAISRCR